MDGLVDNAQAFQSADVHLSVDDQLTSPFERRRRVRVAHPTRAPRVAETRGAPSDVLLERLVGRGLRSGAHILADVLRDRRLREHFAHQSNAVDELADLQFITGRVILDDWSVSRIARAKRHAAIAQTQRWHEDARDSGFEVI